MKLSYSQAAVDTALEVLVEDLAELRADAELRPRPGAARQVNDMRDEVLDAAIDQVQAIAPSLTSHELAAIRQGFDTIEG